MPVPENSLVQMHKIARVEPVYASALPMPHINNQL